MKRRHRALRQFAKYLKSFSCAGAKGRESENLGMASIIDIRTFTVLFNLACAPGLFANS
jgi:hypothetical protein